MSLVSIRGAITVENNSKEDINTNTKQLLQKIISENHLDINDIISIFFSATKDLDEAYPAIAARELGLTTCGLMCFQEMEVKDSLRKCIRIMILVNTHWCQSEVKHIYLKDAKGLRPDLIMN